MPTTPSTYTVADMMDNPIELNSHLGYYTNFANFMRCAAIAVPAGRTAAGLSFGIQIVGPCDSDAAIAPFAAAMHQAARCGAGTDGAYHPASVPMPLAGERLRIAVVGAHLRGMPLNGELTGRGGLFIRTTTTAPVTGFMNWRARSPPNPVWCAMTIMTGMAWRWKSGPCPRAVRGVCRQYSPAAGYWPDQPGGRE
ncbi:amidase family protein [Komagataeibacter rhaeticus]|nr:amidase family protein [Komagataeibacter rhaeticus]